MKRPDLEAEFEDAEWKLEMEISIKGLFFRCQLSRQICLLSETRHSFSHHNIQFIEFH